jgi:hypothetical protein
MTSDSAAVRATKGKIVKPWVEITHYAGFDWARDHHDVVIVDRQGQIVAELRFQHSLEGWQQFQSQVKDYPALAVALETSQGAAVDQLLQLDTSIYPVNPLSAKSYRERKAPSVKGSDQHNRIFSFFIALRPPSWSTSILSKLPFLRSLRLNHCTAHPSDFDVGCSTFRFFPCAFLWLNFSLL